jgi:hypothetical protein
MRYILATLAVLLLCGATYEDKGNVIIRVNDDRSVSTIPKNEKNADYRAYLNAGKADVSKTEMDALKSAVKALSEGKPVDAKDMAVIAPVVKVSDIGGTVTGAAIPK